MTRSHPLRRLPGFVLALALTIASTGTPPPSSRAQNRAGRDTTGYDVSARGRTTFREINGERVLELTGGVTVVHGDVTLTSDRGLHYDGRRITYMIDDVTISQGTMRMWGEEGEYREREDLAILRRQVRIVDEGWEVTCDAARYSRATGRAWLRGNVVARDSSSTLRADSLRYDRNADVAEAFGRVELTNVEEGFTAYGEHGFYRRRARTGTIDRNPRLVVDPDSPEPVVVVSDTMHVYPDSGRAEAYYRVKITKGGTITQCDSAVVFDDAQRAELYGKPLAKQNNVSMNGGRMEMHYDDDEVRRIDILGGAEIREAPRDTLLAGRDSWIRGDTIRLHVRENRVDSIDVIANAASEYYPTTPGKIERNFIRGDRMFFRFQRDSLVYVRVVGRAEGVYKYLTDKPGVTVDSLRAERDTLLTYVSFDRNAERVVYSAAKIEYFARRNDLVLDDHATLRYRGSTLTGREIQYYSAFELLDATGEPELTDAGQTFYGERMNYDMEAETGLVIEGSTAFQQGFYKGEHVAKVGKEEMKVWNSVYTTCNLKEPHYMIRAREMKVYPGDKVVSGPLWLYIGGTPIFYLPFMANNLDRGRQSGWLRPDIDIGVSSSAGRFIRNVGYYWATNDYMDFTFVGDFNENSSLRMFTQNRYNLRYHFRGDLEYNFLRDFGDYTNKWEVRWRHDHTLGPRFSAKADVHYVSDEDVPSSINRIDDVDRVVDRSIRSNVSIAKSWQTTSFSAYLRRTENLSITDPQAIKVDMLAPSVTLSIPSRNLYFGRKSRPGAEGFWEKLLTSTRYSPRLSGERVYQEKQYEFLDRTTLNAGLGLNSPQRVSFLNISPSLSANNVATRTDLEVLAHQVDPIPPDTVPVLVPPSRLVDTENVFSWNGGVSATTNIYGTFYPTLGRLRGIRHTITPSASYRITPAQGNRPRSQGVGLSLRNSLDLKVARPPAAESGGAAGVGANGDGGAAGDGEEELNKLSGVAIWSLTTAYNPEAPRKRAWSTINSGFNLQVFGLNLSWNHAIDPYLLDVLSSSTTSGFRLQGSHPLGRSEEITVRELNVVAAADTTLDETKGTGFSIQETGDTVDRGPGELALEKGRLPWSLSVDLSYSTTQNADPRSTLRFNGQINLTKAWRFTYGTTYDVMERIQTGQNIAISRDLHCWEMSLARQKLGDEWQFYFRIGIRAHPEIFTEQGSRGLGGGTFGTSSYF